MFIVTKLIVDTDSVEVIEVVDEMLRDMGFLVAYETMLEDALQYNVNDYSIKNKSKSRVEVFYRSAFGNSLNYVYQIHATHESSPIDDEKTED